MNVAAAAKTDLVHLAEGLLRLLDIVSIAALVLAIYLVLDSALSRDADEERRTRLREAWTKWPVKAGLAAFLVLLFAASFGWHAALAWQGITAGGLAVLGAMLVLGPVYFMTVRALTFEAVRYTMIIWAATGVTVALMLFMLDFSRRRFGLELEASSTLDFEAVTAIFNAFAQMIGIVIAASMVVVTNRANSKQARAISRQQIYQTIELASNELFRFEAQHPLLVRMLWHPETLRPEHEADDPVAEYQMRQYICQALNLFEMAIRFRRQDVVEPAVFGSWVIWMWSFCENAVFARHWTGRDPDGGRNGLEPLKPNYVGDLREALDFGIARARSGDSPSAARRAFFEKLARQIEPRYPDDAGCPEVIRFLESIEADEASEARAG